MSPLTLSYSTGDVICDPYFPFKDDPESGNARFLICLEDLHDSIFVVPLTRTLRQQKHYPKSFIVQASSSEGQLMRIVEDSLIIPEKAITIPKLSMFKHGRCSDEMIDRLNSLCG
jgi:hypothetical protein